MGRVGWVSAAEDGTDDWYRLSVFDDGWVDLPGMARNLSDVRANLRKTVLLLALLLGAIGGALLLTRWTASNDGPMVVSILVPVVLLAVFVYIAIRMGRMKSRDWRQRSADADQARRFSDQGRQLQRAPGTKLFSRVHSAQAMADALINIRLTKASDIAAVTVTEHDKQFAAVVEFVDGSTRRYTTPDRTITDLLSRFGATQTPDRR